jgi:hypothetical protein
MPVEPPAADSSLPPPELCFTIHTFRYKSGFWPSP